MKSCFKLLAALLLMGAYAVESSSQTITKGIVLRSKEKVDYFVSEAFDVSDEKPDSVFIDGELVEPMDVAIADKKWSFELREVKKTGYVEFGYMVNLNCTVEAYHFCNNSDFQKDIVEYITKIDPYTDSLSCVMLGSMKGAKTIDKAFGKLMKSKGYNSYLFNDKASFQAEISKYPESRRFGSNNTLNFVVENGIFFDRNGYFTPIYDVERGKRIEPSDLFTTLKCKNFTIYAVRDIDRGGITVFTDSARSETSTVTDNLILTPYARSLMGRIKDYKIFTVENAVGDQIRTFSFDRVNGTYHRKEVHLPVKLEGCKNPDKIRKRMLEIMFGRSDGKTEELVKEGVKDWVSKYGKGKSMLFKSGDGLVSFGFEDLTLHNNWNNTFIVFDKHTGDEIKVEDLIKDKKGFMEFVNSHNLYMAGFIFDSTKVDDLKKGKYGSAFRSYLRHSGGYFGDFDGISEFPTSWWFAFNEMDQVIPVEFNTSSQRIFLDYDDIKKYIDPKYCKLIEEAIWSMRKNK